MALSDCHIIATRKHKYTKRTERPCPPRIMKAAAATRRSIALGSASAAATVYFYLITPQALLTSEPPTVPKAWWLACVPVAPMRRRRPAGCKADHAAAGERPARRRGWQP